MPFNDVRRVGNRLVISLDLDASSAEVLPRLRLVPRHEAKTIVLDCIAGTTGFEASLGKIDASLCGRWDVWLDLPGMAAERLKWSMASQPPTQRHLLREQMGEYGFAAYLTESQGSLALYVDLAEKHARVCGQEQAKQDFAHYLVHLPVLDDLVLFESFLGKAYAGNPRYIYEELRIVRPDLRCVWAYQGRTRIPGDPEVVARGSEEYWRLLAQAKYRVNNIRFPAAGKKPETIYLQTWHGTPLKRLSYDITVQGPEVQARDALYDESRSWSLLLSENAYSSTVLARAFRYDGQVLEAGYPLTDALVDTSDSLKRMRKRALGLPEEKRLVLYAPTWRDDKSTAAWQHQFDLNLDLSLLANALPADMLLLIKAHHLVSERLDQAELPGNVLDFSHIEDINDLCQVADVLVTDYSSVFFDFAVTGRPILFYCYDLDRYASHTRGLYLDVHEELPGPVVQTTDALLDCLRSLDRIQAKYAPRYARFRERFCALNDGTAARRVVQHVFGHAHDY